MLAARPITVDDGLSQSHVTCMVQDRQGFVWIGTAVGLNRYDGNEFVTYSHSADRAGSLSGNAIYSLHVDGHGSIWVGTDRGLDRYNAATTSFQRFGSDYFKEQRKPGAVRAIHSDKQGNIWFALSETDPAISYIFKLNPSSREVRRYALPWEVAGEVTLVYAEDDRRVTFFARDSTGKSHRQGFAVGILDAKSGKAALLDLRAYQPELKLVAGERDLSLAYAGSGLLWIGAPGHRIHVLNLATGKLESREYDPELAHAAPADLVTKVFAGRNGELIVLPTWRRSQEANRNLIYTLSRSGDLIRRSALRPIGSCDIARNFIISGMVDTTGVLWTGVSGAGLCVVDLESGMFAHLHETSPVTPLSNNFVRAVWKSPDGVIWVGTRSGLTRIDRSRSSAQVIRRRPEQPRSLSDDEVMAVAVDRSGALWVGTQHGGLNRSRDQGATFERFQASTSDPRTISADHVKSLLEDRAGSLWIATSGGGLNLFHPADRSFTRFRHRPGDSASIGSDAVTALFEDSSGRMWVGTEDAGLYRFDRNSGQFTPVDLGSIEGLTIVAITEDPQEKGALWIATLTHGLVRYRADSGEHQWFTAGNSLLPSSTVYSVLSDGAAFIWAGTNKGLARIDPRDGSFRIFATDQGVQSMEFNTRASFRAADGELFFGGIGGLNSFYPGNITQNATPPGVVITRVRTLNPSRGKAEGLYEVVYMDDGSPASGTLSPGSREVIFSYVALHYSDPARNRYRVKLEGFEDAWRDMGTAREVTYTNLPPGHYRFRVRGVTSRGVWSEREAVYSFDIPIPFYLRLWFIGLAISLVFCAGYLTNRIRVSRLRAAKDLLEKEVQQRTTELTGALKTIGEQAEQLREAIALKSRFITNISHDLRTPLTVTLGTLADLRSGSHGPVTPEIVSHLDTVLRNERRLLRLADQMISIARLDSGKLRLQVVESDLTQLAQEIVAAFRPAADRKGVTLEFSADGPVPVYCDPDWAGQAVMNLVSNSVKFSSAGGHVEVSTGVDGGGNRVFLKVKDDGPGIQPADLHRVFDRFYQAGLDSSLPSTGIGVGLSLAKEIVELHHGEISVASEPGAGATFQITFLQGSDHFGRDQISAGQPGLGAGTRLESLAEDLVWETSEPEDAVEDASDRPLVVIAEDDRNLREYLREHLSDKYQLMVVSSGDAAWGLVQSQIPDLVLSDIMMPGLSGHELCNRMRSSPETDFIPLILLTAKAETRDRIEGLDYGADDYLSKPFEMAELLARIRNLLGGRDRLRTRIAAELAQGSAASGEPGTGSVDDGFLQRVHETIRRNAHQQDFSVERMARELAMSRMHLYRRLNAVAGKSPADLLMEYRLERAAELLTAHSGSVSEIAYGLGFKNVSHFTRRFRERFGHTPSGHRNRNLGGKT